MNSSENFKRNEIIILENQTGKRFMVMVLVSNERYIIGKYQFLENDKWSDQSYGGVFSRKDYELIEKIKDE